MVWMDNVRMTLAKIQRKKEAGEKIVMITAYDYCGAHFAEHAGVDLILVGDSLGTTVMGCENTLSVGMDIMVHHTRAVVRGCTNPLVVADMPFLSYQITPQEALRNAGRLIQEGGAQAVKLEGGLEIVDTAKKLVCTGIPVIGHLGFTPQSVHQIGLRLQGKTGETAIKILKDAKALEEAGVFAIVLELVPWEVAGEISKHLSIPTISIGSGPDCDGQVQVFHDMLGISEKSYRHVKRYADVGDQIRDAIAAYAEEVRRGSFPSEDQSRHIDGKELEEFLRLIEEGGYAD
jgi:3-methyl-2-oxobutanoate hydroxymethyltransferase